MVESAQVGDTLNLKQVPEILAVLGPGNNNKYYPIQNKSNTQAR